ncbi:unnamed protein product [Cylicocyclus nassatus]|uniref:Uncharacterized protein n=1 Tax=Cylicocyclus nassatus TaxID=53992 RepID=A0AA36HB71_CYLNA|nr:unnamed protein product [Cylicocyclus nassatus]
MSSSWVTVLILSYAGAATAQFYGYLGGYACSQPVLYRQCQCPSFCGSYGSAVSGYTGGYILLLDSGYGGGYSGYDVSFRRRHKKRRHHKKRKFRFETAEEPEEELPEPSSEPEEKPSKSKHSWEDEDEWEKKFVKKNKSKDKEGQEGGSEELPEIDDEEMIPAKSRSELVNSEKQTPATAPAVNARSRARPSGEAGGRGAPVSVDNSGDGGQVQPIPAGSSRSNGESRPPGLGGGGGSSGLAGLGNGGLFGISSGIGVGVPGIGPIGVGSGLGIG